MAVLEREIAAYEGRKADLDANHKGMWVVFHHDDFIGSYETLDEAAVAAAEQFGLGPYLIRQVATQAKSPWPGEVGP